MESPLLHLANIIYLASYSVRDILWLRLLTVFAMVILGWFYWEMKLFVPLGWQGVFLAINLVQIWLLVLERRPVRLSEDQQWLHQGPLRTLTPLQVQRFTGLGEWATVAPGECLLAEGVPPEQLILVLSGEANVRTRGQDFARLGAGDFAGEMSFLTGSTTTAEVVAEAPMRLIRWPRPDLDELMERDREMAVALQSALSIDLVGKLLGRRDEPAPAAGGTAAAAGYSNP